MKSSNQNNSQILSSSSPLHNRMLNEMEDDLDTATENLSLVTRKTKELIQKSGGKRNFIIIVALSVVMIILFFLVIYT
jgi:hypothetical protein